jgi:hypothetical protein
MMPGQQAGADRGGYQGLKVANQSFASWSIPGGCLDVTYREDCAALDRRKVFVSDIVLFVAFGVLRVAHRSRRTAC